MGGGGGGGGEMGCLQNQITEETHLNVMHYKKKIKKNAYIIILVLETN